MIEHVGSRRQFLVTVATAGAAASVAGAEPDGVGPVRYKLIGFTKPFTHLSFAETADLVAEVGWDGVECAVRPGKSTHIAPERVEDDLPLLVEELRKRDRELAIVTTGIVRVDAAAEKVLRTTAAVGCRCVRLGFLRYPPAVRPAEWLAECRGPFGEIAALCRELGIQAGYQNHSGHDYLGAPVWDLWDVIRDTDPAHMGACFDIGHATVEGGMAWPLHARLMADRLVAVFVKDFAWERMPGGQVAKWCPLGQGVVDRSFFGWLKDTGFSGPISQHHEYPGLGAGPEMVAHFKRDLAVLREWLAA
jgi:sugar phosphate isomerase/epimerase